MTVSSSRTSRRTPTAATRVTLSIVHWAVQVAIAVVGVVGVVGEDIGPLIVWCLLGTAYAVVVVIVLAVLARGRARAADELADVPSWFGHVRSLVTVVLTIAPALIGASSAVLVIVFGRDSTSAGVLSSLMDASTLSTAMVIKIIGVWAMLLAWGMLHWGFAQMYLHRTEAALPGRILAFPDDAHPSMVDHVYFAFTVGTTFAASDVNVLTSRTRWLVTVHAVLSFFLNGLIVVLSFNTIMGGGS